MAINIKKHNEWLLGKQFAVLIDTVVEASAMAYIVCHREDMNMLSFYGLLLNAVIYNYQFVWQSREYLQRLDEQVQKIIGIVINGNY